MDMRITGAYWLPAQARKMSPRFKEETLPQRTLALNTLFCTRAQAHSLANTKVHTLRSQRKFLEEIMFSLIKITLFILQKADKRMKWA